MPSRAAFLPPKINPLVLGLARKALPSMLRWHAGGIEVKVSEGDLVRLAALKKQRVLLLPNHPTHFDPMVMMEVSRRLDEDFCFVAAREIFDFEWGLRGWLLQRCGVYSLIRGGPDRESFATTQKILREGRHFLVIFIEGEVSLENDTLIPFEPGAMSIALRMQDELCEKTDGPPLHVAPVAMKTFYHPGVEQAIGGALARLEARVGLLPKPFFESWEDARARLNAIGAAVLTAAERMYALAPPKGASLDDRLAALRARMLTKMEGFLDLAPAAGASFLDRVRAIRNRIDKIAHTYGDLPATLSAYERTQLRLRQVAFADFYAELARLVNFMTLRGDYLAAGTPERFAEVTIRLEKEILGKARLVYPRTTVVQIGQILDLRHELPAFRTDRKTAAAALAARLEADMSAMLHRASRT